MANSSNGNPWALDTAGAIRTTPVKVRKMIYKPAAAANDLTVIDNSSVTKWDVDALAAAPAGQESIDYGDGEWFDGFNLSVIDGGTLYVHIS